MQGFHRGEVYGEIGTLEMSVAALQRLEWNKSQDHYLIRQQRGQSRTDMGCGDRKEGMNSRPIKQT